jgi:hypothetical protein
MHEDDNTVMRFVLPEPNTRWRQVWIGKAPAQLAGGSNGRETKIFDAATDAIEAAAVGVIDPHDPNSALNQERLSRGSRTMGWNPESAIDQFARGEHSAGAAIESVAAEVLCLSGQKICGIRPVKLNRPVHRSPLSPAAVQPAGGLRKWVTRVGGHCSLTRGSTFGAIEKGCRPSSK